MATDMNPLLSLDARYYTDPAIFEIESRGLFASSWQFAGRLAAAAAGRLLHFRDGG